MYLVCSFGSVTEINLLLSKLHKARLRAISYYSIIILTSPRILIDIGQVQTQQETMVSQYKNNLRRAVDLCIPPFFSSRLYVYGEENESFRFQLEKPTVLCYMPM